MTHFASHDLHLVLLSVVVAMTASYTGLDLAERGRAMAGRVRFAWRAGAAVAMSVGIWSMHFIAMLAFRMDIPISYDPLLTLLSFLLAVAVTGLAFAVAGRPRSGPGALATGGLLMGLGIGSMHYLGMAAMRMPADLTYDPVWVAASMFVAIGASTVALWLALRDEGPGRKAPAAAAMGLAIAGMHYTAMAAATFTPRVIAEVSAESAAESTSLGLSELAVGVALATLLILLLALFASAVDRRVGRAAAREAARLRDSEEHFRMVYRETPLPLHSLDRQHHIGLVSDAWLHLIGYDRDEVIGRPLTDFMTTESAERYDAERAGLSQTDSQRLTGEYCFTTRDGRVLEICVDEKRLPGLAGEIVILGGLTDLTARKKAETTLRQAQKLETIGQLTGGLAHDFNNLLSVITGNMGLLSKRVGNDLRAARMVASAAAAADRGAALTQRMLAFARRQELNPQANDVPELVRGMADLLRRSIGPGIRVELRFPLAIAPAMVDRNQFEMAIVNLAVNARDAMPKGGTITISGAEATVGEGEDIQPGQYVQVSVCDTGEGMDEATLVRAVDPFFTTKGVGKGTGLGLSMVQGLAAQSGGRLILKSRPGEGTTAELWLPAAPAAAGDGALADDEILLEPEPEPGSSLTVLVVDDDPLVLMGTVAMLEDLGHSVLEAGSGRKALALMDEGARPDVVMTDYAMPRMTGAELIKLLRARHHQLPVVLATGYADLTEADLGVHVVRLGKPFTQANLERALRAAMDAAAAGSAEGKSTALVEPEEAGL